MRCNKTLHSLSISLIDAPLPPGLPDLSCFRQQASRKIPHGCAGHLIFVPFVNLFK